MDAVITFITAPFPFTLIVVGTFTAGYVHYLEWMDRH